MSNIFFRLFRRKTHTEAKSSKPVNGIDASTNGTSPVQIDPWEKPSVRREDVVELLKATCDELKLRGLDTPLFLLPFRPSSDLTSTKSFIRRFFAGGKPSLTGTTLTQELRLTDVLVLAGVLRWVWTRLEGGIVGWESYELFAKAEKDCNYSRDAFNVLIPLSVESELHTAVILDFFAFLASVAAHAKSNGFAGQRLARIAGWYAFGVKGSSAGFVDGYANWEKAANATEHLFLAYLRSISPTPGQISAALPLSLSTLLKQSKYPPKPVSAAPIAPGATSILRITLSVRNVSPTPFALLDRLARHSFVQTNPNEKGDALEAIIEAQANHSDPTKALTPECLRVLRLIAATNESDVLTAALLRTPNSVEDKTWTRFADLGFEGLEPSDMSDDEDELSRLGSPDGAGGGDRPRRRDFLGVRPKTPSWGDFLVSGFSAEGGGGGFSLPPDKLLPPINTTTLPHSSSRRSLASRDGQQGFKSNLHELEKGEVKSVERSRVDDALWSVWVESLCGEELEEKKAVFGRCVVAETNAVDSGRRWIIVEEIVKGAEVVPELLPSLKGSKKKGSKKAKKAEEETLKKKRAQQRRSTSDLIGRHNEGGTILGREQRAQALAKQTATLRTIQEKEHEAPAPKPRRNSCENISRPTVVLGADVSRAMKWADSFDQPKTRAEKPAEKPKMLPETPRPKVEAQPAPAPKAPVPEKTTQEIPRDPLVPPKVQDLRVTTPEPKGPVLLSPDSPTHKTPEKQKSPPNKFKKFFGGKSKEEKAAKRTSRAMSPLPPSPTPVAVQPQPPAKPSPPRVMARTPERRAPSPGPGPQEPEEWQEDFDGTHRTEPSITASLPTHAIVDDYEPAPPPTVPIAPAFTKEPATPDRSDDEDLDRWAQIRKRAGKRAINRVVPPSNGDDDEIAEVNVPRVRQATNTTSPRSKIPVKVADEEEEESVDARVARIRKRVQELTAGMGDD